MSNKDDYDAGLNVFGACPFFLSLFSFAYSVNMAAISSVESERSTVKSAAIFQGLLYLASVSGLSLTFKLFIS